MDPPDSTDASFDAAENSGFRGLLEQMIIVRAAHRIENTPASGKRVRQGAAHAAMLASEILPEAKSLSAKDAALVAECIEVLSKGGVHPKKPMDEPEGPAVVMEREDEGDEDATASSGCRICLRPPPFSPVPRPSIRHPVIGCCGYPEIARGVAGEGNHGVCL